MSDRILLKDDPWTNLSTVVRFDKSGDIQEFKDVTRVNRIPIKNSLLIELLLDLLCGTLEIEPGKKSKLYKSLCAVLHEMKIIGESFKLREFNILRNRYREKLFELMKLTQISIGNDNKLSISRQDVPTWTRYTTEFKETGFIANGGFGKVYKAINYLDGIEYAIKKIPIKINDFNESQLDEVKTLAKLNHTNIVPYRSAWIEEISNLLYEPSVTSSSSESLSTEYESSTKSPLQISEGSSSSLISWQKESEGNLEIKTVETTTETDTESTSIENCSKQLCQYNAQKTFQPAILYIQMALCDKTLRQWMDERIEATPMTTIRLITTQILKGIHYMHSNNIVHHDIKPSNIFISFSGGLRIQLGDFGLACPLQKEGRHSVQGTRMYAAKEQLQGECNPKSDLYSLGIVLLELLIPMQTSMELSILINQLKERKIPYDLVTQYPEWMKTLAVLVQDNPASRPSASNLLELLQKDKDLEIEKLQKVLEKQNVFIKNLQDQIRCLEIENESLKKSQK